MTRLNVFFKGDILSLDKTKQYEIYEEFYRLVYGMIFSMIREHSETEDVIQEAFLRVFITNPLDTESSYTKNWIFKVTRNVTLNYLRKLNKDRDNLKYPDFEISQTLTVNGPTVEQRVEEILLEDAVSTCFKKLKPETMQVLELRFVHYLSYKEIAYIMNISVGAVRQRLARGKQVMKKLLKKEWFV